jgi:hypothetical protein
LEVVLANGRFVTVTEASDPDLFWAIRGGGGGKLILLNPNMSLYLTSFIKVPLVLSPLSFPASTPRSA